MGPAHPTPSSFSSVPETAGCQHWFVDLVSGQVFHSQTT